MPGYKSKTHSKKNLKISNKAKNGGRRRKQTMKKVRRGRKVMRGGEPSPKLTLDEIFVLLGEKDPEALETFKTLFSKDFRKAALYPHKENNEVYDDTLENNPSLKNLSSNPYSGSPPPYTYRVEKIIQNFPKFPQGSSSYTDIEKIYTPGTLTTTLASQKLDNVRKIFEDYQLATPYSNDVILRILEKLDQQGESELRDRLLATVQDKAGLLKDCFVDTPPSKYISIPKPIFSKEKLQKLLDETPDLNKIFTDAIKKERDEEAKKWENTNLRTLGKAIASMD